jgi:hypothetical protein
VAAVVWHNGDGGGHFGRGSVGVVVGSDEGGMCSGHYGSGRGAERWRACAREAAAVAVGPGRRTTGWGPCVSERGGWLAGPANRLRPSGGAGKVAQREGRGDELGEGGGPEGGEERLGWPAESWNRANSRKSFSNFF